MRGRLSEQQGVSGRRFGGISQKEFVIEIEELRRCLKFFPQFPLDPGETAGDMPFGVAENIADSIQWPAGIFTKRQHGEILPFAAIFTCKMFVNHLPELIWSGTGKEDFGSVGFGDRHESDFL